MKLMTTFTPPEKLRTRSRSFLFLIVSGASEKEKGVISFPWPQATQEEKSTFDAKTIKPIVSFGAPVYGCTFLYAPLESAYLFNYRARSSK